MYHLLITLSEGDTDQMRVWFTSYNVSLEMSPLKMCKEYDGVERVADQLRNLKQSCSGRQSALATVEFAHQEREVRTGERVH